MSDIYAIADAIWLSMYDEHAPTAGVEGALAKQVARAAYLETLRQIREPGEGAIFEATCEYQNHVAGRDPDAMFEALWQAMIDHLISEAGSE